MVTSNSVNAPVGRFRIASNAVNLQHVMSDDGVRGKVRISPICTHSESSRNQPVGRPVNMPPPAVAATEYALVTIASKLLWRRMSSVRQ